LKIQKKYPFLIWQTRDSLTKWFEFDIIIAATKDLERSLTKKVGEKKVLFFDLSIPRTYIKAEKESGLILYNIEDLALVFEEKKRKMASEINESEHVLNELIHRSMFFFDKRKKSKERYALCSLVGELTVI
jgi:glutamyl-tRNA reductase